MSTAKKNADLYLRLELTAGLEEARKHHLHTQESEFFPRRMCQGTKHSTQDGSA